MKRTYAKAGDPAISTSSVSGNHFGGSQAGMATNDITFSGSIPALYDRCMVPLVFAPYAEVMARKALSFQPARILETAAGTGVVTEALCRALPDAQIIATDLNPPMLEEAARRVGSARATFQPADALALPFEDASFDLVVCQFGVMFYPDKVRGNSEARRVLRDGGHYLLAIWDKVERNLATEMAGRAVAALIPEGAGRFYERVPFRYHDKREIAADLRAAGFEDIEIETVSLVGRAASARDAAIALVQGTPMRADIEQIDPKLLEPATDAAASALAQFEGPDGFSAPMSAHVVTATR
jgi:ubiquinone/menaquinone biosynthesis C-methylase UbiE